MCEENQNFYANFQPQLKSWLMSKIKFKKFKRKLCISSFEKICLTFNKKKIWLLWCGMKRMFTFFLNFFDFTHTLYVFVL